ncbi:MAG: CdaR family protein [Desulfovibrio sp.]|jgi:hypothetical protein|nr:CdaR family protein [Desulfovibrio sp.]MDY5485689.1 CdaR family protein [Desulfovibrio sp.]MEE0406154.1 CdaR family protein [Desulfovibrio sp.]
MTFSKYFRRFLTTPHLASLLISIIAATGMWYVVSVRDRIEAQFDVFIDYYGIPQNLMVTDGLIKKISIRLKGPETLLRSIPKQHLNQQVNLSEIKRGVNIVPLSPDNLQRSFRAFEVVDIQPPRIVVRADNVIERKVAVKPVITSPLRHGALTVDNVVVTPSTVVLRGPESTVSDINNIKLPIQLDPKSAGKRISQTMPLDTPSLVTSTPGQVNVQYTITSGRSVITRRCRVGVQAGNPDQYVTEPPEIKILVEVPEALAGSASYLSNLQASVIPPDLPPGGKATAQISYRLPEGMTIVPPVISEIVVRRLPDTDDADTAHEIHEDAGLKSGIHPKK